MYSVDPVVWARQEFGHAELGDARRRNRLVRLAAQAAQRPAGTITTVLDSSAERQGAYGLLENPRLKPENVALASHQACAARCQTQQLAFVALDITSLKLTDRARTKGFGRVGAGTRAARGLCALNALAVRDDGLTLGVLSQDCWARPEISTRQSRNARAASDKETGRWITVMRDARRRLTEAGNGCVPWFQVDRGGDAWPVLLEGLQADGWLTVRSAWDRLVQQPERRLWSALEAAPALGCYCLSVPAGAHRLARLTTMQVRARQVTLVLRDKLTNELRQERIWAVSTRELDAPAGEAALHWRLLTTRPVLGFMDACLVVFGYSQRWRIEEFHRLWKSGLCSVESTQLRARARVQAWAAILAAVAARHLYLTHLARLEPDLLAVTAFSPEEVQAVLLLKDLPEPVVRAELRLAQVVLWIAELGGYTGKSSGGPPGPTVIARGLQRVKPAAQALHTLNKRKSDQC